MVLEKTLESPLDYKEIQPVHSEGDQPWDFFGRNDAKAENSSTLATSCEELTHWKRFWCWEGVGAEGEGDNRGWDGWMASLTWWTWVWVNSGSWWWTGRPGVLRFMGSQRVGHNWATELNWRIKMIKSVPKNICLKTCPTRFPGAQSVSLYPELPQGLLKVNSYSSMGFNLPRGT